MGVRRTVMFVMVWCLCLLGKSYAQTAVRIPISTITPSIATGQDYSPWLNDDVTNLVANVWAPLNMQWVDVKIKLASKANISQLKLYDYEGTFESYPVQIYAAPAGGPRTLINTFLGLGYKVWNTVNLASPVLADTIIVHKYGNCIPEKIQMYGTPVSSTTSSGYTVTGGSTLCVGASTPYACATTGGTWSSSNTAIATVNSTSGYVTGVSAGTATITYTKSGVIGTKMVTVGATPSAGTIWGTTTIAVGGYTSLTNATTGGVWSSSATGVATVSSTGVVYGVAAGTATITYAVSNACGTATTTKVVTVTGATSGGTAVTISGSSAVCTGSNTALTASVAGGTWSSSATGVATVSSGGTVTGVAAGTATISYTSGSSVATTVVTVSAPPSAGTIWGTATIAVGGYTSLTNATTGGVWSSSATGVATVSSTGVVYGVAAGTATITYAVSSSCGTATTTKVITVAGATSGGTAVTISGSSAVCTGSATALTASVAGGTWSSSATGVAVVSSGGVVTGVAAGTATISYTSGSSVATTVVTVSSTPTAGTISGASSVNTGSTTSLTASGTGGTWSSSATGVATVSSTGVVTGVAAGSATITYSVSSSCGTATATQVITVTTPSVGTISGTATVCAGATTALTASVSGGTWSSSATGVATVTSTGVVTGVSAGTATISYMVSGATATRVVTVNAAPSAGTISGAATVIAGSTAGLTASVSGGTWSSSSTGVATVNTAGVVTGVAAGTTTISYTVSNGCGSAVATQVFTVAPVSSGGTGGSGSTGGVGSGTMVSGKIPIDPNRWYQLNNCSNGLQGLFDGNLTTAVNTGYGKILTNFDAYYPVNPGEKMNITSVKFYDGPGSNETQPFKLYYIDSAWNRVLIGTYIGTQYNTWVGPDASNPTNFSLPVPANNVRYLVINCSSVYPLEMELYGTYMTATPVTTPVTRPITLKQQLGVNAFEWDFLNPSNPLVIDNTRMNAIRSFGCVRHYLDWQKLEPTAGGYTFNPSHSGGWNMDTIYATAKAQGIEMLVDIKTIPTWLQSTYPSGSADAENVPVSSYGLDFSNPNSYLKQAKLGFQFAARYGSNSSVSSSLLSVDASIRWSGDPANVVRKGLNYVKYIECDNERDKWWKGRNAYQTGREYAANLSAFYDGNKNTMGAGVGVKNADPNMQVVMGGVAMPTTDYVRGMIDWCKEFRGYNADGTVNLCWDVINYHIYPDNGTSMQGGGTAGAAPEGRADSFAKRFVDMSRQYANGMPVWVTETGYDLNQSSKIKAIPIGAKSARTTQADWSLRNSLMYARMGVERTFFYMLDDVDSNSSTVFSSCGLVYPNYSRRPVADYMWQTKRLMGDYVYKETISTNPLVDRYELAGQSIYVLVKPTQNGSTMSYSLSIPGMSSGTAKIYSPAQGQDSMSVTSATVSGGAVSLTVTETPMFVKANVGAPKPAGESSATVDVIAQPEVTVYPNPTNGVVNFVIDNQYQGNMPVTIYSEGGQVVKTLTMSKPAGKYTNTVDLSNLPNGLYIVEVGRGQDRVTKKIIKVN